MSRGWKEYEGVQSEESPNTYQCLKGDTTRSAVQVDVAQDGMTVIMQKEGAADECVKILGGFTLDQLRWIYSTYNEDELERTGWDTSSLKNSDNDPSTHLWSELDERCQSAEIRLSGDFTGDGVSTTTQAVVDCSYSVGILRSDSFSHACCLSFISLVSVFFSSTIDLYQLCHYNLVGSHERRNH